MQPNNEELVTIIAPLFWFDFNGETNKDYKVDEDFFLISNPMKKFENTWKEQVGNDFNDLNSLKWGFKHILRLDSSIKDQFDQIVDQTIKEALLSLWITKPTITHIKHLFVYDSTGKSIQDINYSYFFVFQKENIETLSLKDFEEFKTVFKKIRSIFDNKKEITRVLYYLYSGLTLSYWQVRFIMLNVVLESLFSTDNQELSHKISERAAFFLEKEAENREKLFQDVKKIYNIRSKLVHGDVINNTPEENSQLLNDLERITQVALKKIINEDLIDIFSEKPNKRNEYFTKMIFQTS